MLDLVTAVSLSQSLIDYREVWKFVVRKEDLSVCWYVGDQPCFVVRDKPIVFLFDEGVRFVLVQSEPESELPAVAVLVLQDQKLVGNSSGLDMRCTSKGTQGGTCYQMDGVKRFILMSEGSNLVVNSLMVFGKVPAIIAKIEGN